MTQSRRQRPRLLTSWLELEDRLAPATFTANIDPTVDPVGAVSQLVGFMNQVNTNGQANDTIVLEAGAQYTFTAAASAFDGGTALPVFVPSAPNDTLTIQGNGAMFLKEAGST